MRSARRVKKVTSLFLILLVFSLIFSCVLESMNPLGTLEDAEVDEKLLGLWELQKKEANDKDEIGYMLVLKKDDKKLKFILFDNEFSIDDDSVYDGFISRIKKEKFLNLQESEPNSNYLPAHYQIKGNNLRITLLNEDHFEKAIENGKIQGKVSKHSVVVTDTTENLRKYIESSNLEELLDEEMVFHFKKINKVRFKK